MSIVFTSEALWHLVAEYGASQIVMGTDYPYPWTSTAVEHILGMSSLSDTERAAILGDNACKLLRMASQDNSGCIVHSGAACGRHDGYPPAHHRLAGMAAITRLPEIR